ncbi:MAG TPA: hypothetical protein VGM54_03315 [Chthoniobacter sp.]|jgi:hypothetical protein
MIEIRADQMSLFAARERETFVRRVMTYLRTQHEERLREFDDAQLQALVGRQISAAATYGIGAEADVVLFIEMSLAFGNDFHCSWRYPAAERILNSSGDGTSKMQALLTAAQSGFEAQP